jgi:hypothetical protein
MSVTRLKYQIRTMNRFEDPPNFLILHIAGNDIGLSKIGKLRAYVNSNDSCYIALSSITNRFQAKLAINV